MLISLLICYDMIYVCFTMKTPKNEGFVLAALILDPIIMTKPYHAFRFPTLKLAAMYFAVILMEHLHGSLCLI